MTCSFVREDYGAAALFVAARPARVLVLAHGFPWPDDSQPDDALADYARATVERWRPFAEDHDALLVVPVFGGKDFPRYREMTGRLIGADEFVTRLVEQAAREHLAGGTGRFSLHGHSAGAQFAARYLVTHPGQLEQVVLSAPSTFPMPDATIPWPHGMGAAPGFTPDHAAWPAAASEVPVTVLVGARDVEPRPAAPGQQGETRIERAEAWVEQMRRHAAAASRTATIRLVLAEDLDHDEEAMTPTAQELLAGGWQEPPPRLLSVIHGDIHNQSHTIMK